MVVVGRSSSVSAEVRRDTCRRRGVPILRRSSGGAAIVAAPGCLMYAAVLDLRLRPALRAVDLAHQFVLGTLVAALRPLVADVACAGTSDLAWRGRKVSGNSLRIKREHLVYHGTLLYDLPLELVDELLAIPPRQPDYRQGRAHGEFVANLPAPRSELFAAMVTAWNADEPATDWPRRRVAELVRDKYSRPEWNES
jgi:lipoate-protein ligase A